MSDILQRPKGRHSAEEDPVAETKERKSLFGRKDDSAAEAKKERKPLFGKGDDAAEPEPFVPPVQEPVKEPEPVQTKASINLAGSTPQEGPAPEPEQSDFPDQPPEQKKGLFGRKAEDRKGTWGDRGYSATDEEAHRDRTYRIPSFVGQTVTMFMVQMRLYSKMKWTYFMLFMAVLIPIVSFAVPDIFDSMAAQMGSSTEYIGTLLAMMPIFLGFFTAVLSGPSIGREFKERTAYMNVSLPVSRASFYLGKYLAGLLLSIGIFMFAYGMAVITAMTHYDFIFADLITESLATMIVAIFVYSSTAFCIGAFKRKPSSMAPFILMTFLLPALFIIVALRYEAWDLMLLPCFLPDVSLAAMGTPMVGSVSGFMSMVMGFSAVDAGEIWTMVGIGVVWGLVFLILGLVKTMRREM